MVFSSIAHEWGKHGTCSGLNQYDYLTSAINVLKKFGTPSSVTENINKSYSADQLRADWGGSSTISLQCTNGQYLSGAFMCLAYGTNGIPGGRVTCPADVHAEDTCTGSTVFIQGM